ncbi:hypothetical protein [uncultured Sphingomonas sp.]|uniref:hypothetical protein n=1 Tax=uncultured Sphingomonas sp. TaxID=158754 RepID=UPI002612AFCB|nr:hypothetical protein [uncultured Sphingomonas sp.]
MGEGEFEPHIGRIRSRVGKKGRRYIGKVVAAAARTRTVGHARSRRFDGSRIGRAPLRRGCSRIATAMPTAVPDRGGQDATGRARDAAAGAFARHLLRRVAQHKRALWRTIGLEPLGRQAVPTLLT